MAEADIAAILRWTVEQFGETQARLYSETLVLAMTALVAGPDTPGLRDRSEILKGLYTLHAAHGSRRARHVVMVRISRDPRAVDVLRLLHDAMDLPRYLPAPDP